MRWPNRLFGTTKQETYPTRDWGKNVHVWDWICVTPPNVTIDTAISRVLELPMAPYSSSAEAAMVLLELAAGFDERIWEINLGLVYDEISARAKLKATGHWGCAVIAPVGMGIHVADHEAIPLVITTALLRATGDPDGIDQ